MPRRNSSVRNSYPIRELVKPDARILLEDILRLEEERKSRRRDQIARVARQRRSS